jgi:dipeptidase
MGVTKRVFGGFLICLLAMAVVLSDGNAKAVDACTVIAVGRDASADGSVIVTHANDGMRDFRIVRVPGRLHVHGSTRPVFYDYAANGYLPAYGGVPYLRYVGKDRGPTYNTGQTPNIPLGYIEQVPETATYYEGTYPIMNVHQVSIGETTCEAKVEPMPDPKRLFYSASLARVVLERCNNAQQGVRLIGNLIETYGYHGTGECLVVADTEEIWVVEMCGYAMDGSGGLWVAKRVPDDAVFVSANQFRIREVDPNAPDTMYCENLFDICKALGWWKPDQGKLDWLCAVSNGEFNHPYYSLRRVWRIFSLIKPSADFPAQVANWDTKAYPFSVKPDRKLSVTDVMTLHRDVYEGTSFDLTKGLAAGSFGDPRSI